MKKDKLNIFWFRRDLRLHDNAGLYHALKAGNVLPVFIFDTNILGDLNNSSDPRLSFIYRQISLLKKEIENEGSSLLVQHGKPEAVFRELLSAYEPEAVYLNKDYEPYTVERDEGIRKICMESNVDFKSHKDQVIFEKNEIIKNDGDPYIVFTPYKKKWLENLRSDDTEPFSTEEISRNYYQSEPLPIISLKEMGFEIADVEFPGKDVDLQIIKEYDENRDLPYKNATSRLGIHLRFGTVSIREWVKKAKENNEVFLEELIWREFFMMILWHFPFTVDRAFKKKYDSIKWRNSDTDFKAWCEGKTGYPMVDAGMRQLNETGFMHNRVRMIAGSFLVKHLLIDWRWGEAYFADKLLDYELSSNVGNWQWVAGSGCDAAPYFRIFNPDSQQKKFDPELKYIKKWIPEFGTDGYPQPVVDYKEGRERALKAYQNALN